MLCADDSTSTTLALQSASDDTVRTGNSTVTSSTADDVTDGKDDTPSSDTIARPWAGWAELENDPTIFTTLLREWGVPSIQVNEVVPLDSIFDHDPDEVFGLIFLSRWVPEESENEITEAPKDVWFANQTSAFSCATVSLMNIVNNHPNVDLGDSLNEFRSKTMNMTPKERGLALDTFDHVREVHNSFATDIDKMNVDLRLKQDFLTAEKKKKAEQSKHPRKKRKQIEEFDDEENGFHFVAYVPAEGFVWKMDGMEVYPRQVGALATGDSWVAMVLPELQAQWESASTNDLEFSLLSLTKMKDPSFLEEDQKKMDRVREDWEPFFAQLIKTHAEKGTLKDLLG
ncbi:hypothetical protein PV08_07757 [Exophiala spinifera]|uniref:ubiquitinyl hydrolase 1 n=1 Tax=Exophiala spinifera TaxID=91928 RepID=A0A0D2B8I1_9EURO|nr:uncharacterized protein PV08_07757 [Exophiala spinifera]KIW14970.1 hypothetical protein PV08_07757 [Exophiala spinifera]